MIHDSSFKQLCALYRSLRGSHGQEPHPLADKILRLFFLVLFTWPLLFFLHWSIAITLIAIYVPSFLDGTEIGHGRTPWKRLKRGWLPTWLAHSFFRMKLVKTQDLDSTKRYIFAVHPHAILPLGGITNIMTVSSMLNCLSSIPAGGLMSISGWYEC